METNYIRDKKSGALLVLDDEGYQKAKKRRLNIKEKEQKISNLEKRVSELERKLSILEKLICQ